MFSRWFFPVLFSAVLLASCGYASRQETPAYFNEVTGLHLCDEAEVRNKDTPATANAGIGVVYVVSLRMTAKCEADFRRQVDALRERVTPNGYPIDDASIDINEVGGELIVTYTS